MYRLLADVFNDLSIVLDCLSPALPQAMRVVLLGLSSILRALCGVAAGSSKASLSAHFARWGNLGELNAKDASQETVISLMGMMAGSIVVARVTSPLATWACLISLLAIHLATNRAAVRAVIMRSLNRQRANLVISSLLEDDTVLNPDEVSRQEAIFERDGILRWKGIFLGYASIGVELHVLLSSLTHHKSQGGGIKEPFVELEELAMIFQEDEYLMWYDSKQSQAYVVFKENASPSSQLQAWAHALLAARESAKRGKISDASSERTRATLQIVRDSLKAVKSSFERYIPRLQEAGWDLETVALETRSGYRIVQETR
ncbi:MAG: hypothetical protein M1825_006299 [Sarcosagium campestre]|nr:MAG: hypothetical protein M1825_006299 [Sarcosagium campestre]